MHDEEGPLSASPDQSKAARRAAAFRSLHGSGLFVGHTGRLRSGLISVGGADTMHRGDHRSFGVEARTARIR